MHNRCEAHTFSAISCSRSQSIKPAPIAFRARQAEKVSREDPSLYEITRRLPRSLISCAARTTTPASETKVGSRVTKREKGGAAGGGGAMHRPGATCRDWILFYRAATARPRSARASAGRGAARVVTRGRPNDALTTHTRFALTCLTGRNNHCRRTVRLFARGSPSAFCMSLEVQKTSRSSLAHDNRNVNRGSGSF